VTPLADLARSMFAAAVAAVAPDSLLRRCTFLPDGFEFAEQRFRPSGKMHLVAAGKAAPGLAAAFLHRSRRPPDSVFVLAPDGVPVPGSVAAFTRRARHPLPDARGAEATRELHATLAACAPEDGVVLLLSGGSSALLALPLPGVDLATLTGLTAALLAAGISIRELNTVRKHLLAVAGGRLALVSPAPIMTLVLSDVPGDDLASVASGPTVADPTTFADAAEVLERHALARSFPEAAAFLAAGARGDLPETPKPGDPRLAHSSAHLLGGSREALCAAASVAREAGFRSCELTRALRGEARSVGTALAALASTLAPGEATALLLAGETTVSVRGAGRGGRNLELALAAACGLADVPERCLLAAGTDGVDGSSPAAGAVVDGETVARGAALGRDAAAALEDNDAWGFFDGLPDIIVTGPTGTNVADLAFILAAGAVPDFLPATRSLSQRLPTHRRDLLPRRGGRSRCPAGASRGGRPRIG
jgi:glycerate 2-kinase